MNIREWFGCSDQYDDSTNFNRSLDNLLCLYVEAVARYFKSNTTNNVQEMIAQLKTKNLSEVDNLFLNWFLSKGYPSMRKLADMKSVQYEEEAAIGEINYQNYILQEEMDFHYPEDVRSSLISIATDLQSIIEDIQEQFFSNLLVNRMYEYPLDKYTYDLVYKTAANESSLNQKKIIKKREYSLSIEESAEMQVLFSCSL